MQIIGSLASRLLEIEDGSKAARVTPRPIDVLGSYTFQAVTGTMAAGLAANAPIFSFRWGNASNLALLKRMRIAMNSLGTGFTAGIGKFEAFFARSFTASDSGGTAIVLTTNEAKRRTSFGTSLVTDARVASTATLTAGTRTKDTLPFVGVTFAVPTTVNFVMLPTVDLWVPGLEGGADWPLVFAQNEGLIIQATVPATGTWSCQIGLFWDEVQGF